MNLDSDQSKSTLKSYLKYKKKYIEVSADATDPQVDPEVKRYLKLSTDYLKQYHQVQANVKASYKKAQANQKSYFRISAKYNQESETAKASAAKVKRWSDQVTSASEGLLKASGAVAKQAKDVAALEKAKQESEAALTATQGIYKAASTKASTAIGAVHKLAAMQEKLSSMAKNAAEDVKLQKLRTEAMAETSKAHGVSITVETPLLLSFFLVSLVLVT